VELQRTRKEILRYLGTEPYLVCFALISRARKLLTMNANEMEQRGPTTYHYELVSS